MGDWLNLLYDIRLLQIYNFFYEACMMYYDALYVVMVMVWVNPNLAYNYDYTAL